LARWLLNGFVAAIVSPQITIGFPRAPISGGFDIRDVIDVHHRLPELVGKFQSQLSPSTSTFKRGSVAGFSQYQARLVRPEWHCFKGSHQFHDAAVFRWGLNLHRQSGIKIKATGHFYFD
jgi:hypothetical protein